MLRHVKDQCPRTCCTEVDPGGLNLYIATVPKFTSPFGRVTSVETSLIVGSKASWVYTASSIFLCMKMLRLRSVQPLPEHVNILLYTFIFDIYSRMGNLWYIAFKFEREK